MLRRRVRTTRWRRAATFSSVNREDALRELPSVYAVALRMADAGAEVDTIARALGVPVEAVPALVEIGRIKLARLMDEER